MMTDLSLTLTPAKRAECEVMTHPDEPPKRLYRSPTKDHGSELDSDSSFDPVHSPFLLRSPLGVADECSDADDEKPATDAVRNSEDYKEYPKVKDMDDGESLFPTNSSSTVLGKGPTLASWYQDLMPYFDLSRLNESAALKIYEASLPCELGCDGTLTVILNRCESASPGV
ncbi:hypothetical protein AAHA92_14940 [Salvia divinorum]|uniref:Uncharacterized protein n=1 Tax=Salvia divinorum TaxID=28513 RepID=A0ABD1HD51_SALDI